MRIGIDFYDTITDNPSKWRRYIKELTLEGHHVYIISAIHACNIDRLRSDFRHTRNAGALMPVVYDNFFDVPRLKYEACKRLGINVFIDDRKDTCDLLGLHGIKVTHYKGWKDFNDKRSR